MQKKISNVLIGIAGVHYVVSELSRRGMIALPTVRNTAGYDVIVMSPDGKKHANIQVKTSSKRVDFWLMPPSKNVREGPHDIYVFLRWLAKDKKFEGYLLKGQVAKSEVADGERWQRKRVRRGLRKQIKQSVFIGRKNAKKARAWAKAWQNWSLQN